MLHVVLAALGGARFTNLRTDFADESGLLATAGQEPGRQPACRRAIDVKRNATRHCLRIFLR
jgi:hypothetical protein